MRSFRWVCGELSRLAILAAVIGLFIGVIWHG